MLINEKPILFSAPMVRAINAGIKTQTRRVINPQPDSEHHWNILPEYKFKIDCIKTGDRTGYALRCQHTLPDSWEEPQWITVPYGRPGNHLWVREKWNVYECFDGELGYPLLKIPKTKQGCILYAADGQEGPFRPSIHMPRWASRTTLEITDIRAERLQDITEDDAKAEGITQRGVWFDAGPDWQGDGVGQTAKKAFEFLWDSINFKKYPWMANPWVWVISFKRIKW